MAPKQAHGHSHITEGDAPPGKRAKKGSKQLPVLVLTGYLGAGKTTLLNYLLTEQREKKLAVIENEVGEVSVDDALVEQKADDLAEELIVLDNGCVCCTIRGDFVKTFQNLATRIKDDGLVLDGVLVELTGAADPAPVVQTFMMHDDVRKAFYVDNVIALVDAKHAVMQLEESQKDPTGKGTACAQIAFASTVLLNKVDLVESSELDEIEKRIKQVNSVVEIVRCENAKVEVAKLFNVRAFDLTKVLSEQYMDEEEFNSFYKPKMDLSISNVGVRCHGAFNMMALQMFLDQYLEEEETAKDFLRIKGVIHIKGSGRMFVVQCVHMLRNQSFTKLWKKGEIRETRMIFIGRGMEKRRKELTEGLKACVVRPLRFEVGAKVEAKTGDGETDADYSKGSVLKLWDEFNAYRVKLASGEQVHAPIDDDMYIRAQKE